MPIGRLVLCWLTCLALGGSAAWGAAPAEAPWAGEPMMFPDAGSWGINVHTPDRCPALKALGCQWTRLGIAWHLVEKNARGQYDWAALDHSINIAQSQGYHLLVILKAERLNPLYEADKADEDLVINAIADCWAAAAERYKGKNIVWEIGNEPEVFPMGGYWNDPQTYTKLARLAAKRMKEADPDCRIAALSLAWMDRSFASACMQAGLLADGTIDILSFHGYHRRNLFPESGLAEDVAWLRSMARRYAPPGHPVIVIDSERGYGLAEKDTPKKWHSWRNLIYTESEQAAYLARHYLEEISLGLEVSIWYKDFRGENGYSLFYGLDTDPRGLRPMGDVYRNLATLLPENPKKLFNDRYAVSLVDLPDKIAAPDGMLTVRMFLRRYMEDGRARERLVVAVWNPVEAFDGRILEKRERVGDEIVETWRDITPDDTIEVPLQVQVAGVRADQVKALARYDLLAKTTAEATQPLQADFAQGFLRTAVLKVGPMPTVIVLDLETNTSSK